jgi:drug/metabolite transporter (DMT)-like permease
MVTLVGVFLFKESVSALKVISIALIIAGVVSLNLSSRATDHRTTEAASRDSASAANTMALTSSPDEDTRNAR